MAWSPPKACHGWAECVQYAREQGNVPHVAYTAKPEFSWLHHTLLPVTIDEAFADLTDLPIDDLSEFADTVKQKMYRDTGLPVRVSIAPTRCLIKIGCELLKSNPQYDDVLDMTAFTAQQMEEALAQIAIEDVFGIGRKYARFLRNYGIATARDLRDADERWIRKHLTVVGARIQLELKGVACIPLEIRRPAKRQLINAKSFGRAVESREELVEAVSTYMARLGEKLREQEGLCGRITVFLHTNGFDPNAEQYANEFTIELPHPTAFTPTLITHALIGLEAIYRPGLQFKKVGIVLSKITPLPVVQVDLFGEVSLFEYERQARLMCIVDALNRIYGRETLFFAVQGMTRSWKMRQGNLSGRYLSRWDELPTVT